MQEEIREIAMGEMRRHSAYQPGFPHGSWLDWWRVMTSDVAVTHGASGAKKRRGVHVYERLRRINCG